VWSDKFTAAFFVSFIVIVFVPDIEATQNKLICSWIGTTCSMNVTSTCKGARKGGFGVKILLELGILQKLYYKASV